MLFIITAQVSQLSLGIERNRESTYPVTHIVDADSGPEAESIVISFYEQKSDRDPYGERYQVSDTQFFKPLSLADIKTS